MVHSSLHSPVLMRYVSVTDGDDAFPGTSDQPFKTISRALKQAIAGTTIYVAPGHYSTESGEQFPLIIPTDMALIGDNRLSRSPSELLSESPSDDASDIVLIAGSGFFFSPTAGYQRVTLVPSHRSLVQGVTITNGTVQGTGVWIESAKMTLRHCHVNQCQREGIVITTAGLPLIQDCRLEANHISGLIFLADGAGILERTVIQQHGDSPTGYGIAIRDRADPKLIDNQVTGHQVGIAIAGTATPSLTGNHITHNQNGIVVMETAHPHLGTVQQPGNNAIASNQHDDIQVQTPHLIAITGNYLPSNNIQGNGVVDHSLTSAPALPLRQTSPTVFPDNVDHWARPFIEALHQQGIIQGFPDGTFRPDESLTRAQYAALLTQLFDLPVVADALSFRDVKESFWAATAIRRASEMGFIAGFPDGTVRPNRELTRVQAIVSLVNGLRLTGGEAQDLERYDDRTSIPTYAKDEVATATHKSLVVNYPDPEKLEPNRPITRSEMAVLLYQVQVLTGQVGAIASRFLVAPSPNPVAFKDVQGTGQLMDVPSPHWAAGFIGGLAERRLISGFDPDKFAPERAMSRAEFAALLVQLFNPLSHMPPQTFIDVPSRHWAVSAIQQVTQAGLLNGFGDGSFQPQLDIKRWQMFTAVIKALALPETNPSQLDRHYFDLESVPAGALGAIATATQHRLVVNYPNLHRINGNRGATRAEVAATLYQSLTLTHRLPAILSPYIVPTLPTLPLPHSPIPPLPHSPTSPLPHSPTPQTTSFADLLLPTVILSPVAPIDPIADIEQYFFGHSNQASLIAQTITAQLLQQGINAITYHPQMQVTTLKHDIPTDSDLLVRLQVLDQPVVITDPDVPLRSLPSINDVAWHIALSYDSLSASSQSLARTLHQQILGDVGLGDRGLHPMSDLWPDLDTTTNNELPPTPTLAVLVSLSPIQIPGDDYPPIPISGLVRVLVNEIGDRLIF